MSLFRHSSKPVPAVLGTVASVALALAGLVATTTPSAASPTTPSNTTSISARTTPTSAQPQAAVPVPLPPHPKCKNKPVRHLRLDTDYTYCQVGAARQIELESRNYGNELQYPLMPPKFNPNGSDARDAVKAYSAAAAYDFPEDKGLVYEKARKIHDAGNHEVLFGWWADGQFKGRGLKKGYVYFVYDMYETVAGHSRGKAKIVVGFDKFGDTGPLYFTRNIKREKFVRVEIPS